MARIHPCVLCGRWPCCKRRGKARVAQPGGFWAAWCWEGDVRSHRQLSQCSWHDFALVLSLGKPEDFANVFT